MKRLLVTVLIFFVSFPSQAQVCPDPQNSSLLWGEPPPPWQVNPFSPNNPQGDIKTVFVKADILVTAGLGQGISCTYQNSIGKYSIWQPVKTKIPAPANNHWIGTVSGYLCSQERDVCVFYSASE